MTGDNKPAHQPKCCFATCTPGAAIILMAQFLQCATPANTTLKATQIICNLSPTSATHAPNLPLSSNSRSHYEPSHRCYTHSRPHCPHIAAAINHPTHPSAIDQCCTATTYTCRRRDHWVTSLPLRKTCTTTDPPNGQQYIITSASSDVPKDHTRLDASGNWLRMQQTYQIPSLHGPPSFSHTACSVPNTRCCPIYPLNVPSRSSILPAIL